jgi:cytochrome c-type biogenesis protein CcsB
LSTYLFYGAFSLYLVSALCYLFYLAFPYRWLEKSGSYALLGGFCAHFASTAVRYSQAGYTPITNLHESLSFLSLCVAGFFLFLKRLYKISILGVIILPATLLILIWSIAYPATIRPLPPALQSHWLPVHAILAFLGNGIFFVSFFVSLLYLVVERGIKKKRSSQISSRFPSLETLDAINYRCMSYGFPFLTIAIITGSLWASTTWGSYWSWDPKETWSLITWIVYAILIHNRLTMGWRGRKTAYMMILGFFSILFTFIGVSLYTGGLHSYL